MAKGGFKRALKIENDVVKDHRPLNSKEVDGSWLIVDVPNDIPATINQLIQSGLTVTAGKVNWPKEYVEPEIVVEPSEFEVLVEAMRNQITKGELDAARARLKSQKANDSNKS